MSLIEKIVNLVCCTAFNQTIVSDVKRHVKTSKKVILAHSRRIMCPLVSTLGIKVLNTALKVYLHTS